MPIGSNPNLMICTVFFFGKNVQNLPIYLRKRGLLRHSYSWICLPLQDDKTRFLLASSVMPLTGQSKFGNGELPDLGADP